MELQSIIIDFLSEDIFVLFDNKINNLNLISDAQILKEEFNILYRIDFDKVIVQITDDQHMSEARLLCFKNNDNPNLMITKIITLNEISKKHIELYNSFKSFRDIIETELKKQLDINLEIIKEVKTVSEATPPEDVATEVEVEEKVALMYRPVVTKDQFNF
jgi:hypothetical protein